MEDRPEIESESSRNIYDLLRTLISKASWSNEAERDEYIQFVNRAEQLRAFGDRLEINERR